MNEQQAFNNIVKGLIASIILIIVLHISCPPDDSEFWDEMRYNVKHYNEVLVVTGGGIYFGHSVVRSGDTVTIFDENNHIMVQFDTNWSTKKYNVKYYYHHKHNIPMHKIEEQLLTDDEK